MEEASKGKVAETTLKEVAETGDVRKEGAFEEDGEYNHKVEARSVIGAPVVDGNSGEATETRREKEAKDSSSSSNSSSSSSDDEEEEGDEKEKKEEKIVPLAEEEEGFAVSVEHVVVAEEALAATEDSEKVDAAAAVGQEEETEAEIPSDETANGVVLPAGAKETAPVAVDESDVAVPVVAAAAAAVEERATEEPELLAEEEEVKQGDSTPAAADATPKERGEDSSPAQPPADAPAISEGGIAAEQVVDDGEIPESTGRPPMMSRRTAPPTSWRSCCGLFEVLRRSDR